jgi:hypothetical protein
MKPIDPLECELAKLANANFQQIEFEHFRSSVWREIRHRQAVVSISTRSSLWQSGFLIFDARRLGLASAFVAVTVGVALGVLAAPGISNSHLAARNLDLGVFSNSAVGLPSNFLASRK